MMRSLRPWLGGLVLLVTAAGATSVRAGAVDRFLPADTEVLMTFHLKQAFDSGLAKKLGIDKAQEKLKEVAELSDILKDLGFDPFKDLERILIASPGSSEHDKGLIIVHGTFDLAKFKAKGEDAAKMPDHLKIHKAGDHVLYEVTLPDNNTPGFVALADKNTMLISGGKDYVTEGLKKADPKEKATLKSKDFQALLEKQNDKQTVTVAALGTALLKGGLADVEPAKEALEKMVAVGGGLTVGDDLKVELVFTTKTADDAKAVEKVLDDGIDNARTIVGLLAGGQKELGIVLDLLKSIKTTVEDKTVIIKGGLDADAIDKALKKDL